MKKILIIPLLFLLVVITQSCQKKIKACEGMVEEVKGSTSMVVVIGDDGVKFDINDARYTNGAIMVGDSVKVEYVGDLDEKKAKAVIVYLIPKKGNVVNAGYNSNAELKTKPMDSITKKKFDEFVESAKKDR